MSKSPLFHCTHCDAQFPKWIGRCDQCGKWGTVELETHISADAAPKNVGKISSAKPKKPTSLSALREKESYARIAAPITQINTVLGGGFVPGSLTLLGGDPGVGKSTLALHIAGTIDGALYISAEESLGQVHTRAERLGITDLTLLHETHLETILATITTESPSFVVIDSIQTIRSDSGGAAGSVSQIRACTAQILEVAKQSNTPIVLIGHVTKDGAVAGPKTLEHLVDVVLYFEGDTQTTMRILRSTKNRFGSTDEIGIFAMEEKGLVPISNPTAAFLTPDRIQTPGSVLTVLMDGKQPLIVEVQALTTKTVFGYPQRKSSGFDLNRLQLLIAVLTQRAGLPLNQYDVHVNVVGGIQAKEPAVDLAIAMAIMSSLKNHPVAPNTVAMGEIGLGGEIRPIRALDKRIIEAKALGFETMVTPQNSKTIQDVLGQMNQ